MVVEDEENADHDYNAEDALKTKKKKTKKEADSNGLFDSSLDDWKHN